MNREIDMTHGTFESVMMVSFLVIYSKQSSLQPHWEKKRAKMARRAIWLSVTQLSLELELHFGAKHDYEEKNGSPPQKRADFKNYSPREPFWLSFFSQCT